MNMTESKPSTQKDQEVKTFKHLMEDVIEAQDCCSCGACVAYCESQSFDVIEMEGYTPRFKSDKNAENCTECGLCYYICPQTKPIIDQIETTHHIEDEVGNVLDVIAAKTSDKAIAEVGQDGGVVTTILSHLFETNKIDAAIVSEYDKDFEPIPKIIFNKEELLKSAGTRYSISSQILPLKDLYNIPEKTLQEKGIYDIEAMRVAFVGTPCQVRALSKMKFLNIKPAHVIKYIISLFCFENFNSDKLYQIIKKKTKVNQSAIKKTWIKKNFFLKDEKDKEYEIDIKKLDPAVRSHCHKCDEFTGKFSDISVGASGAPAGHSMIIIRTPTGQEVINSLISHNLIEQYIIPADQSADWKDKKVNWFKKMISFKTK